MRIDHINALDRSYQCTARYLAHSEISARRSGAVIKRFGLCRSN